MSNVATRLQVRRRAPVLLLVLAALTRCTSGTEPEDPPPGTPGAVTYRLSSPNGPEGAMLLGLPADEVLSVRGGDFRTEVISRADGGVLHVAVVDRFGIEGLSLEVEVTDASAPPQPTLLEVAGPDDRMRALAGYVVEIDP